jgi:ABC-type multidrug transport system fused ATPase/permease subunit
MELTRRPLFYWVLHRYRGLQLLLLAIIVASLFFRVFPLEMQRRIVNIAINLRMLDALYLYCGLYMGSIIIAGLMKYGANVLQEAIGQKILIWMRREIYQHLLQLPLSFFHRTQTGTTVSAMGAELNAIGSFLGGALAIPISSFLTFVVFLGFMVYLNPLLGFITALIYPIELVIIPLLQRWYNRYNRERVAANRELASMVNEAVSGIQEVQGSASFELEQNKLNRIIQRLYKLVVKLAVVKYGIKFSNNLFQSFGPFLLFLIGGYLAINGEFTLGALFAFLSAYEKVYDPWKEVIEYYQLYQDSRVRYAQIIQLFDVQPQFLLSAPEQTVRRFKGEIEAKDICYSVNDRVQLLNDVSFHLPAGKHMALVGFSGSGKSTLSLLVAQLHHPTSGTMTIDGVPVQELSKTEISSNIASVAQHPFIFTGTVRDNVLYSSNALYLNDVRPAVADSAAIADIIKAVGLSADVIRWGLSSVISDGRAESMAAPFLAMRRIILDKFRDEFSVAVEFYDTDAYLDFSSISENLTFGTFSDSSSTERLISHQHFRSFLKDQGLEIMLYDLGFSIGAATTDFLGDFKDDEFFFQGSPMNHTDFDDFEKLVEKVRKQQFTALNTKNRDKFLRLALDFIPGIHKIATLRDDFKEEIIASRLVFLQDIADIDLSLCAGTTLQTDIGVLNGVAGGDEQRGLSGYTPFCTSRYLPGLSLRDNILFGNVINQDLIWARLDNLVLEEFERTGLIKAIIDIGLDFHVGSKGDNLSGGQKQKIAIARAFLKKSPILILDEATASLDNSSQARVQAYIESQLSDNTTVIAVVHRLDMISGYDHIVVMKSGRIVESGTYADLLTQRGVLYGLINDSSSGD